MARTIFDSQTNLDMSYRFFMQNAKPAPCLLPRLSNNLLYQGVGGKKIYWDGDLLLRGREALKEFMCLLKGPGACFLDR